jgi:hypothetical protein
MLRLERLRKVGSFLEYMVKLWMVEELTQMDVPKKYRPKPKDSV